MGKLDFTISFITQKENLIPMNYEQGIWNYKKLIK